VTTSRRTRFVLLALAVLLFAANAAHFAGLQLDDSFISFRYARNLVEGHGLVFNPGDRVEGYTNFLFVLAAALLLKLGIDPLAGTAILTFTSALAAAWLTDRLDREAAGPGIPRFPLAILLLLASRPFAYWTVVSLETMPFAALLAGALLVLHRETARGSGHLSSLLFLLLTLTRPEGALCFAAAFAAALAIERARRGTWGHLKRYAVKAAAYALPFGIYLSWRLWYYGSLVPNTYRAKVTWGAGQLGTGFRYAAELAAAFPLLALAILVPIYLSRRARPEDASSPSPLPLLYPVTLVYAAYIVLVGGDHMPFFRFAVFILPLLCVLAAEGIRAFGRTPLGARAGARAAVAVLVAAHVAAPYLTIQAYRAFVAHRTAVVGDAVGRHLARVLREGALVAVNTAGTIPYASRLPTLDTLGLTDAAIAGRPVYVASTGWSGHRRGWGSYVLERRPEVVLWYNSAGSADPFYLGDRELAASPGFRFFYRLRVAKLPPLDGGRGGVIARFLGFPFGRDASMRLVSGDLGLQAILKDRLLPHTSFEEAPIVLRYFQRDPRDADLGEGGAGPDEDPAGFVQAVAARWRAQGTGERPFDPEARARAEALCGDALEAVQAGELDRAKRILSQAATVNEKGRLPLVYQYIANVAVESGDLWAALPAQKEALRLAPANDLYADNLAKLLTAPLDRFGKKERLGDGSGPADGTPGG